MAKTIKNWSMAGCEGRFYVRGKKNIIWYRNGTQRTSTGLVYSSENKILAKEKVQFVELNRNINGQQNFTISEAYRYFLQQTAKDKAKRTIRLYTLSLQQLLTTDCLISDYVAIRQEIANNLTKLNVKNRTKNTRLTTVRSFFQYFIDYEFIEKNPVTRKMFLKTVEKPIEIYEEEELKLIFKYLESKKLHIQLYFKILYFCAMRREELAQMTWEQVVDEQGNFRDNIIIPLSKFKNKVDTFPLSPELIGYFNLLGVQKTGKIFERTSKRYYTIFKEALDKTGVKAKVQWDGNSLCLHTLRKTRISEWLFKDKIPVQIVAELSRDNIQTVMKFYAKLSNGKLHDYLK